MLTRFFLFFVVASFLAKEVNARTIFGLNNFDITSQVEIAGSFKIFKPSRIYTDTPSIDPNKELDLYKYDYGFGGSINYLHFEYSPLFGKGHRYMAYLTFANKSPVNPYFGINYIRGTGIEDEDLERDLDSLDALLGLEISYFKYIKPYVEYIPVSALWFFGVRFELGIVFDKRQ